MMLWLCVSFVRPLVQFIIIYVSLNCVLRVKIRGKNIKSFPSSYQLSQIFINGTLGVVMIERVVFGV